MNQILKENLSFIGHLSIFGAKNTPKEDILLLKKMPKDFLHNSKATLKKSGIRLFRPQKDHNTGASLVKKVMFRSIFDLHALFLACWNWKKDNIVTPGSYSLLKEEKKHTKFFPTTQKKSRKRLL